MEEKRDTENLIASDTAAAPITPMEEVDVPAAATPLGRSRVRSLARSAGALLAFAMVGLLVLYGASRVFEPKNNGGVGGLNAAHQAAEAFLGEPENSLDALFIGDSETYSALSPVEIWKDTGIPSYICAIGKQYLTYSKSLLNRALAVQNPKVVMIEGNSLFRPFDEQKLVKTAVKDAFPIFERHNRWKALTPEDFVAAPENTWVDDMKGFRLKWGIRPADASKYMASDERVQEVPELTMTVLRQMADACHADGAQMVLIATPSTKNWSQARHNGMVKVAEELGIDWIDLNTGDDEVAIDWDTDTRDYGDHLNYYGATKASRAVADILRDRYGLQDHRADGGDTYRHWNRAVRAYERQIEEAEHFNATCLAPLGSDLRATLPLEG